MIMFSVVRNRQSDIIGEYVLINRQVKRNRKSKKVCVDKLEQFKS